jgi:hypothetical protein
VVAPIFGDGRLRPSKAQARAEELNACVTLFQPMGRGWDRAVIARDSSR